MPFEFDAEKYSQASAHQKEWGDRLIAELDLRGDERVLDLGCGEGAVTAQLAEHVPRGSVVGIDASQTMIAAASVRAGGNLQFVRMDVSTLNFDTSFDLVFSNATLHWIKDHQGLVASVFHLLNDGGIARFNFGGEGNCANLRRVIQEVMKWAEFRAYFDGFDWPWYMPTVEAYEKLVSGFPFREVQVWIENADRYFPNAAAIIGWIDQPCLVPFLRQVAPVDKQAFRDTVVDRMIAETRQGDGRCFETFRRLNLFAKK